ncbi:hypothetical protein AGRA3207_007441 [Actinomadura graeca]|uniref:Uncharacterized protein n=1 Tax=Actinomadura graeca TaxID=2750812 RepID=A0ABX8R472_9ACTN|nr:hypothetical protein [Actinomadura graeca]QXJ25876.1 hypothetical protein AGRA3207_007441 [Actinomadura graeca]
MPPASGRDPDEAQQLENLRVTVGRQDPELYAKLVRPAGKPPFLRLLNRAAGDLAEDVSVRAGATACDPSNFLWSWGQVIGPVSDLDGSAASLRKVLATHPQDQ